MFSLWKNRTGIFIKKTSLNITTLNISTTGIYCPTKNYIYSDYIFRHISYTDSMRVYVLQYNRKQWNISFSADTKFEYEGNYRDYLIRKQGYNWKIQIYQISNCNV